MNDAQAGNSQHIFVGRANLVMVTIELALLVDWVLVQYRFCRYISYYEYHS